MQQQFRKMVVKDSLPYMTLILQCTSKNKLKDNTYMLVEFNSGVFSLLSTVIYFSKNSPKIRIGLKFLSRTQHDFCDVLQKIVIVESMKLTQIIIKVPHFHKLFQTILKNSATGTRAMGPSIEDVGIFGPVLIPPSPMSEFQP